MWIAVTCPAPMLGVLVDGLRLGGRTQQPNSELNMKTGAGHRRSPPVFQGHHDAPGSHSGAARARRFVGFLNKYPFS